MKVENCKKRRGSGSRRSKRKKKTKKENRSFSIALFQNSSLLSNSTSGATFSASSLSRSISSSSAREETTLSVTSASASSNSKMTTGPSRFELPSLPAATDGWGPSGPPASLEGGVPYAPFSKGERIGRIADFTPSAFKHGGFDRERERERMVVERERDWEMGQSMGESVGGLVDRWGCRLVLSLLISLINSNPHHQQAATTAGTVSPRSPCSTWQQTRR